MYGPPNARRCNFTESNGQYSIYHDNPGVINQSRQTSCLMEVEVVVLFVTAETVDNFKTHWTWTVSKYHSNSIRCNEFIGIVYADVGLVKIKASGPFFFFLIYECTYRYL